MTALGFQKAGRAPAGRQLGLDASSSDAEYSTPAPAPPGLSSTNCTEQPTLAEPRQKSEPVLIPSLGRGLESQSHVPPITCSPVSHVHACHTRHEACHEAHHGPITPQRGANVCSQPGFGHVRNLRETARTRHVSAQARPLAGQPHAESLLAAATLLHSSPHAETGVPLQASGSPPAVKINCHIKLLILTKLISTIYQPTDGANSIVVELHHLSYCCVSYR